MSDKYGIDQDPYCYPGTNTLINLLDIQDEATLERAERKLTELAIEKISFAEPPYNFAYVRNIHRILFSEIYEWAGEIRTVDISLGNTRFCTCSRIAPEAGKLFCRLEEFAFFINLPKNRLIEKAAEFYTDVNVLHPFRDGNGRVQRILFEHLILNCGYSISWQQVSRQDWIYANIEGFNGRNSAMTKIFARCIGDEISS